MLTREEIEILSFQSRTFSEGSSCAGNQIGSHKSGLPCWKGLKFYHVYPVPLINPSNYVKEVLIIKILSEIPRGLGSSNFIYQRILVNLTYSLRA